MMADRWRGTTASSVRSDGIRTVIMTMCVSLCYIA
jgi:hypothetical protein